MKISRKSPIGLFVMLYAVGLAYGVSMLGFGDAVGILTAISFGVLGYVYYVFLFLAPVIACIAGLQSMRSVSFACLVGFPCMALFAFVSPVVSDRKSAGVPIPWLALFPDSQQDAMPQIQLSLEVSSALFVAALAIGFLVRRREAHKVDASAV